VKEKKKEEKREEGGKIERRGRKGREAEEKKGRIPALRLACETPDAVALTKSTVSSVCKM